MLAGAKGRFPDLDHIPNKVGYCPQKQWVSIFTSQYTIRDMMEGGSSLIIWQILSQIKQELIPDGWVLSGDFQVGSCQGKLARPDPFIHSAF